MECREAERLVQTFIHGEMPTRELARFLEHIDGCEACREELSIQFLVSEGMQRLEDGDTFDLQQELERWLAEAHRRVRRRKTLRRALYCGELSAIFLILILSILVILL